MNIDVTPLNYGKEVIIDEKVIFNKEQLKETELIDLKNVKVKGYIKKGIEDLELSLKIKGIMILPCSRSLEPTEYDFVSEVEENIQENKENFKKTQKTIDILPIIWENILMEIPIKIINPKYQNIELKGDGWELITDSDE